MSELRETPAGPVVIEMGDAKNVTWAIKVHGGKVVILLNPAVEVVELEVNNCLDIAEALATAAFEARGELPGASALKLDLGIKAKKKLVPRIMHILKSVQNKPLQYQSETIVDTCLSEVL